MTTWPLLFAGLAYLGALIACVTAPSLVWVLVLLALGGVSVNLLWRLEG